MLPRRLVSPKQRETEVERRRVSLPSFRFLEPGTVPPFSTVEIQFAVRSASTSAFIVSGGIA